MDADSAAAALFGVFEQKILIKLFTNVSENAYFNGRVVMNLLFDGFFFSQIDRWSRGENTNTIYCQNTLNKDS